MWKLKSIKATNICAFETLEYAPLQGKATLIFGDNQDSDSQNSNGSGKSALIEAIAIGLTGDTLRKVNMDEIINDRFDIATVCMELSNDELGISMRVDRKLSRKQPQEIVVWRQTGPYDTDVEEVKQATVADYNKYVLDQIGLSKDDVFSNFILTARKYKSFLSSSDKDKKEIINRFSNGLIVDESIDALQDDMKPIIEELHQAEKQVANCNGRVSALEGEIERTINESAVRNANRQARIETLRKLIKDKQAEINEASRTITIADCDLDDLDELDKMAQKLEKSETDVTKAYGKLKSVEYLKGLTDYAQEALDYQSRLASESSKMESLANKLAETDIKVKNMANEVEAMSASNAKAMRNIDEQSEFVDNSINELLLLVRDLRKTGERLNNERVSTQESIAEIQKTLAGVIECPKCHHEFVFDENVDIEGARHMLEKAQKRLATLLENIKRNEEKCDQCISKGAKERIRQSELASQKRDLQEKYDRMYLGLNAAKKEYSEIESKLEASKSKLLRLQDSIANIHRSMFDEVFDIIDKAYKSCEQKKADAQAKIEALKGGIALYEEQISNVENAVDEDILSHLKDSKTKCESDLQEAIALKEEIESRLGKLRLQESIFVEFKTYLANTKINAIAQITNEFLATIGSDIRVSLSGYTILKSGKIRDKISVSVLRDGMDCGSIEKFSAGERVRLELASILAMRQLTNVNADDGKGLDLLICDEILDSSDESGLANIFKALNETGVTSLVVSHGNIAEGYPNKLIVTKQNGVSFITWNKNKG